MVGKKNGIGRSKPSFKRHRGVGYTRSVESAAGQSDDQESTSVDGDKTECDKSGLGQANNLHRSFDGGIKNVSHPVWNKNAPEFKPKILEADKPPADVLIDRNLLEMENKGKSSSGELLGHADTIRSNTDMGNNHGGLESDMTNQLVCDKYARFPKKKPKFSAIMESRIHVEPSSPVVIPRPEKSAPVSYTESRDTSRRDLAAISSKLEVTVTRHQETKITVVIPRNFDKMIVATSYLDNLKAIAFYVNPLTRCEKKIDLLELLNKVVATRPTVLNPDLVKEEKVAVSVISQTIVQLWKTLNTIKYANLGFADENELKSDFPVVFLETDFEWEAEILRLIKFVDELAACPLPTNVLKKDFDRVNKESQEILDLIEKDDRLKLAEMNIHHKGTPQIRILHGLEVSDSEIFEVVKQSVCSDYGCFLWIVENKPDILLRNFGIADAVVSTIHMKMLSKDLRPLAALVWIVPKMLQSLTPEELFNLSEKYIGNKDVKIGNWTEALLFGYQMRWLKKNCGHLQTKCIIEAVLSDPAPVVEITSFLLFCALIAELGEGRFARVYDNSTDSFCSRIGRVLASNIPLENKKMLLNSLMALPDPVKKRLLAAEDMETSTSLYYSAEVIIMLQMDVAPKIKALELLGEHISMDKVVNTIIFPNFTSQNKMFVAPILINLVKLDVFRQQVSCSESGTKLLSDISKLALDQYADPTNGKTPRYPFMKKLLNSVDDLVSCDDTNLEIADSIKTLISSQNFPWYQKVALVAVCFPKSKDKVSPSIPLEDIRKNMDNIARILQSWPEEDDVLKTAFENTVMEIRTDVDQVLLTYELINVCLADESRIKDFADYVVKFAQHTFVPSSSPKKPNRKPKDNEEIPPWFRGFMDNADVKTAIKNAVVSVARRWRPYSKLCANKERSSANPKPSNRAPKHRKK